MNNTLLFILALATIATIILGKDLLKNKSINLISKKIGAYLIAFIIAFVGIGCGTSSTDTNTNSKPQQENVVDKNDTTNNIVSEVHFINTGNSDAILIKHGDKAILIDGGDNDDEGDMVAYLKKENISKVDYMIATHPHADHIGGLDAVIKAVKVEHIFVANGEADTKTYRDFINVAANKGLNPSVPLEGIKIPLSDNAYMQFYNTNGGSNTNDQSLVMLYVNGNDKFLFTGDAEEETEHEILDKMTDIDVLKVAHHGSKTGTTTEFLNKVKPEYAVIMVGKDNKYNHPHKVTMDKLKLKNIEVHRNDECGDIIFKSTGNGVSTDCKEGSYDYRDADKKGTESNSTTSNNNTSNQVKPNEVINEEKPTSSVNNEKKVYWTPNGKSYHTTKDCSALSKSKVINEGTISQSGKTDLCDRCN